MPTKYPADGKLRVFWVEGEDGINSLSAPTTAELNAGTDLSCDIMTGGLDLGISSATIETGSVCSKNISQANGRTSVNPKITFWRYEQPDDTAWNLVEKDAVGFLVVRTGMDYEDAWANTQQVTVIKAQMSEPAPEFPGGDTATTFVENFVLVNGADFDQKAYVGGVS